MVVEHIFESTKSRISAKPSYDKIFKSSQKDYEKTQKKNGLHKRLQFKVAKIKELLKTENNLVFLLKIQKEQI